MSFDDKKGGPTGSAHTVWPTPFPLPNDTARALDAHRRECSNLGLWLDRYVDWAEQRSRGRQPTMEAKKRDAPMLRRTPKGFMEMGEEAAALVEACRQRSDAQRESLKRRGYVVSASLIAAPDYRLALGFGAEHVLETGICLHRIYGFPLIPGSSLKGAARARAFWEVADELEVPDTSRASRAEGEGENDTPLQLLDRLLSEGRVKEQEAKLRRLKEHDECRGIAKLRALTFDGWSELARAFYGVFGTTEQQGGVTFFDAYPINTPTLETDVLNPHYVKYYGGGQTPPANYFEPVPTYFLTVARGTHFRFALAGKDGNLVAKAEDWLTGALEELGVGSKTASGYGLMSFAGAEIGGEETPPSATVDPDTKKADEIIMGVEALRTQDVAGCIHNYYERWRDAGLKPAERARVAAAIVAKIRGAGREKASRDKGWYRELLESLGGT